MTNVKMKTVDQLFISSIGPDTMPPGTEFEVSEATANELENRGVAKRVGGAKAKAEPAAPENKMEPALQNKAVIAPVTAKRVSAKRKGK